MPALGWDPCPGDVRRTRWLAGDVRALARRVRDAEEQAHVDAPAWRGAAALGFRARVAVLPACLGVLAASLGDLAGAVEGWADELVGWQERADALERRAWVVAMGPDPAPDLLWDVRGAAVRDAAAGRPPGSSLLSALAPETLAGVRHEAQRLHEQYCDAAELVARRMSSVVGEGLRADWGGSRSGVPGSGGLLAEPARPAHVRLGRWVQDGYGEHVRADAEEIAEVADVFGAAGAFLTTVPVPAAAGIGLAAGAVATVLDSQLELFVAEDPLAAVTSLAEGSLDTVVLKGSLRTLRRSGTSTGPQPPTSPGSPLERGERTRDAASTLLEEGVDPWEVPGHQGTARRTPQDVERRRREEERREEERRYAQEVTRCVGSGG
ncbi:hypothetical protein [Pseudokineococcus sp. 1T1Z-3]|uniref:hypothetical protein n=1 Tax=Pseudokineococcus sp. 1T1Z-3 TaxID=3132745 RepID=UPI0030AF4A17